MLYRLFALLLAFVLGACASPQSYQLMLSSGGFEEMRLTDGTMQVSLSRGRRVTNDRQRYYLERRCAEITLESGRRWFRISPRERGHLVTMLEADEGGPLDAVYVIRETDHLSEGYLSARAMETLRRIEAAAAAHVGEVRVVGSTSPNPPSTSDSSPPSGGPVHVRGYTRKDGTYVAPHTRSAPGGKRN